MHAQLTTSRTRQEVICSNDRTIGDCIQILKRTIEGVDVEVFTLNTILKTRIPKFETPGIQSTCNILQGEKTRLHKSCQRCQQMKLAIQLKFQQQKKLDGQGTNQLL